MFASGKLQDILFLDIETAPLSESFDALDHREQHLFDQKTKYQRTEEESPADFYHKAGIWAEFGKVICISCGVLYDTAGVLKFKVKSFCSDSEYQLLNEFKNLLDKSFNTTRHLLCAHNGKEFDFPFLSRRMIINEIDLPKILRLYNKKPWEVRHLDTMELWKFGDYKHFTSVELLAHIMKIKSPKDDISGADVSRVFYQNNDLKRIVKYCENDTVTVARIYLKLMNRGHLRDEHIFGRTCDEIHS